MSVDTLPIIQKLIIAHGLTWAAPIKLNRSSCISPDAPWQIKHFDINFDSLQQSCHEVLTETCSCPLGDLWSPNDRSSLERLLTKHFNRTIESDLR